MQGAEGKGEHIFPPHPPASAPLPTTLVLNTSGAKSSIFRLLTLHSTTPRVPVSQQLGSQEMNQQLGKRNPQGSSRGKQQL